MNKEIKKIVITALFVALAVIFHYLESLIVLPIPIPGFKLGLANIVGLVALIYLGGQYFLLVNIFRVIIVALISTGFGTAFFLALGGMCLSSTVTLLVFYLIKKMSIFGISSLGALSHVSGQILVYILITSTPYIILYLPILATLAIISGVVLAYVGRLILLRLPSIERIHQ